jgi:hypothetical protein
MVGFAGVGLRELCRSLQNKVASRDFGSCIDGIRLSVGTEWGFLFDRFLDQSDFL